jgi:phosphoglucosamine mutase
VRGVAGEALSASLAVAICREATRLLAARARGDLASGGDPGEHREEGPVQALIIRDTRESGPMLEAAAAAGVSEAGGDALLGGVLPTPAAPLLIRRHELDLAIVISASHNPYRDNGIKLFGGDGFKLDDASEERIEAALRGGPAAGGDAGAGSDGDAGAGTGDGHAGEPAAGRIGGVRELHGAREDYLRELHQRFRSLDLRGLDVLLDCAHGATYEVAPEIFRRLGATVAAHAVKPDGRNINDGCGSVHVDALARMVRDGGHDVGFAFDGDGDRVLAVDETGAVVDGDELLALAAPHLRDGGRLAGEGVVVTVMTNYGFHAAMEETGIAVATTDVGDRYVLEELRARGWTLGGEQSGHIVELGFNSSGDGIASALLALEALAGRPLSERGGMSKLPQRLVNVRVRDRTALERAHGVHESARREQASLAGRGRVLVRASGTEPVVRVMVEAPTAQEAEAVCGRLARSIERELG